MERSIHFLSERLELEGLLAGEGCDRGVVVTHPHPLYGGSMHNPVVEAISRAYLQKNYATLKFNFRGVGGSDGEYGNGIGEQQDVIAAVKYLYQSGLRTVELAGYSFGAWVNARLCSRPVRHDPFPLPDLVMVSPPVGFLDFDGIEILPGLKLVISGSDDEIASLELIKAGIQQWNPEARLKVISGADHFYSARLDVLQSTMEACLH